MFANMIRSWNAMSTYRKIRRVISLGLIAFGIWALSPYLYTRRVNEAFPVPGPAAMSEPTAMAAQDAMAKPTAIANAMSEPTAMAAQDAMAKPTAMANAMSEPTAMAAQDAMARPTAMANAMSEPTAMANAMSEPVALSRGSFVPGSTPGDRASGSATVYAIEHGTQVLRLEDFATTNGPDLFVVLSGNANPDADGIGAKEHYVQLAALKGNQGNQNYDLPTNLDLGQYKSVVIWCRTFNIVFGYAALQPAS
ncbi:MAG TPA: DM13 domain-containing protein [Kouleothrix sp.]|uniref:DM13 domain-containing protein n=1 Tax=Kouleothrix sp. TaxID=2779161 RepID=UPI002C5B15A7|nr:DM13 domain-containing protein [Kouleothrix sp.]HRC74578.1 DM13 domain-containing protein [Kouleothrix sp.]